MRLLAFANALKNKKKSLNIENFTIYLMVILT